MHFLKVYMLPLVIASNLLGAGSLVNASISAEIPQAVGDVRRGSLLNGVDIHEALRFEPSIAMVAPAVFQYGTLELTAMLLGISEWVHRRWPGDILQIGDISKKGGGKLGRHASHQMGLDVDIAYLPVSGAIIGRHSTSLMHGRFKRSFVNAGEVTNDFDIERNYLLLEEVVRSDDVTEIFVDCAIKKALATYISASGDEHLLGRQKLFDRLTAYPDHTDHFHVRLSCPGGHPHCQKITRKKDHTCDVSKAMLARGADD